MRTVETSAVAAFDPAPLQAILAAHGTRDGALIPVLQETQAAYGYVPKAAVALIAASLGRSQAQIYGVVTFYTQFHLKPRGRHIIRVCLGTACHVRGGDKVFEQLSRNLGVGSGGTTADMLFTLERVACVGACGLAPTMMVDDATHGRLTPKSAVEVIEGYRRRAAVPLAATDGVADGEGAH